MLVVAITGGIACGKSTAAAALREAGVNVIDADAYSRALTAPGGEALPAIRAAFGGGVFTPEGELDRRALARIVFADARKRAALEAILHPLVRARIDDALARFKAVACPVVAVEIPLLYEAGMEALADIVWCLVADEQTQIRRLIARDGLDEREARARIASQMPLAEKIRRADVVIETGGAPQDTRRRVLAAWQDVLRKAETQRG